MKLSTSILARSGRISSALNIIPQNLVSLEQNQYFSGFIVRPALLTASITFIFYIYSSFIYSSFLYIYIYSFM